ncbi:DNA helicase PcrA [Tumebacillus flagellatus]|uniref:ATP-dependent DNA helicase n=1 Tax=Tumebacillus flagellatus TaxID=1157490 RepID=A0A074LMV6_9BACL|nr:DNA helicase PcrA [Tumebacillus flagellatus]KEO81855.1 ATP-dependent DNA helicase PcrA [Tumebacillus flagellatus]
MFSIQNADSILNGLNPQQQEAVKHASGPLLIIAGAGTGKTSVLTRRIAYMISERRIAPWHILAITFTNKAAAEMRERVEGLIGPTAHDVWISTFHSMCVRVLRRDAVKLGYTNSFTILDASDQLTAVKQVLKELNLDPKKFDPRGLLATISNAKNELMTPEAFSKTVRDGDVFGKTAVDVYAAYQRKLKANNSFDFDDLIMKTVYLFEHHEDVLAHYQNRLHYLHVDEYQDTNRAQYKLVQLLAKKLRNICVVGDSDQSIYAWRGADISNILNFEKDYPDATVIKLEQNYRSVGRVLQAANEVIRNNVERKEKNLWSTKDEGEPIRLYKAYDEHTEAQFVIGQAIQHVKQGGKYSDIAVLYRTNAQSRVIEEAIIKSDEHVPYQIFGGLKFYERKEIKDILAYLRLIANQSDDISWERVINVPKRGVGNTSVDKILAYARLQGISAFDACKEIDQIGIKGKGAAAIREFVALIAMFAEQVKYRELTEITNDVLDKTLYRQELEMEKTLEADARLENLDEFLSVTAEFDQKHELTEEDRLVEFLGEVALLADSEQSQNNLEDGAEAGQRESITLMTLHAAKGLEFPVVFLVGLEEGVFPSARAMIEDPTEVEEERRLMYVGITRAEEKLFLSCATSRMQYGQMKMNPPSRFLKEIPPHLLEEVGIRRQPVVPNREKPTTNLGTRIPANFGADMSLTWEIGEKVEHRKWGIGTIVETEKSGNDLELHINFPGQGVKKLLAMFAPITKA